ncbi:MAG: hypothetical protein GY855_14755 [candidate division Zixibacteria bacterium]|nr:hypothetical protein [candidate division Zixibacteria bacterium]
MDKTNHEYFKGLTAPYEMGLLDDSERMEFEEHLLNCDKCFTEVAGFQKAAQLVNENSEIYDAAKKLAEQPDDKIIPIKTIRAKKKSNPYLRIFAVAAIIIIMIIPAYFIANNSEQSQIINLLATRSAAQSSFSIEDGGELGINFICSGFILENSYVVMISSFENEVIYTDSSFSEFDSRGTGKIILPVDKFSKGYYKLSIYGDENELISEFSFLAE